MSKADRRENIIMVPPCRQHPATSNLSELQVASEPLTFEKGMLHGPFIGRLS
jgi:hypothetical protein